MIEFLMGIVSEHWAFSVYFGTVLLNENVILPAFSLSVGLGWERYLGVGLLAGAAVLTNDIILYGAARYGVSRLVQPLSEEERIESWFEKIFFRNILFSLLFIKFLFGIRTVLTLYLITKKKIGFFSYVLYSLCGIFLYVILLGIFGWLIGQGVGNTVDTYERIAKIVTSVFLVFALAHGVGLFLRRKNFSQK